MKNTIIVVAALVTTGRLLSDITALHRGEKKYITVCDLLIVLYSRIIFFSYVDTKSF